MCHCFSQQTPAAPLDAKSNPTPRATHTNGRMRRSEKKGGKVFIKAREACLEDILPRLPLRGGDAATMIRASLCMLMFSPRRITSRKKQRKSFHLFPSGGARTDWFTSRVPKLRYADHFGARQLTLSGTRLVFENVFHEAPPTRC